MNPTRQLIFQGRAIDLGLEQVVLEGREPFEVEVIRHPGGAGVVALNAQRQVCLIYQYRHAADGWIWEIPAGRIDLPEKPDSTAPRELQEEVGLVATRWDDLGEMLSTPGFCSEIIYLYLARDLTDVPTALEAEEILEPHWVDFDEALKWAINGKIRDSKTIVALFRAQALLSNEK